MHASCKLTCAKGGHTKSSNQHFLLPGSNYLETILFLSCHICVWNHYHLPSKARLMRRVSWMQSMATCRISGMGSVQRGIVVPRKGPTISSLSGFWAKQDHQIFTFRTQTHREVKKKKKNLQQGCCAQKGPHYQQLVRFLGKARPSDFHIQDSNTQKDFF